MVSALVRRSRDLAGDTVLCSWARYFTLTVPLSTTSPFEKSTGRVSTAGVACCPSFKA